MKFVALDFETSHLDPNRGAPVSLAVALFENGQPVDSREWTFCPPRDKKTGRVTREYDVFALKVSGKTLKDLEAGLPCDRVMTELRQWAKSNGASELCVVAFNAPFDFAWYSTCLFLGGSWNQAERRFQTFTPPLTGPWQCVRLMAVEPLCGLPKLDLDTVAEYFGLSRSSGLHGALEDAVLCGTIFSRLTEAKTPC